MCLYVAIKCDTNIISVLVTSQSTVRPQLRDLMRELWSTAAEWENIGINLEIPDGNLIQIKADHPNDSSNCMREMLRVYLRQVNPPPSWEAVAETLDFLGHSDLAENIRSKY